MVQTLGARRVGENPLPLIDMGGLWSSRPAAREAVGRKLRAASIDRGFFYIVNHGVPAGLVSAVLAEARRFFDLPIDSKRLVDRSLSRCRRGYDAYRGHVVGPGTPPDLKEGFALGADLSPEDPRVLAGRFDRGPNLWPEDLPGFRPTMTAYFAALLAVTERLMGGIALSLNLPEQYFADFCRDPMATLGLLRYPPQPPDAAPGEKGAGAHTDGGALTILLQDEVAGLQVYDRRVGWVRADPMEGAFLVNIGDMLERWSNDLFRSTVHRVVNQSGRDRHSVPFFFGGNPDQRIEALPGCFGPDNPPRYPAATAESLLRDNQQQDSRA